jgi:hypothetical protein
MDNNVINFDGVSDVDNSAQNLYVKPGAQVLTVKEVESLSNSNGKEYLKVTFESDKGGTFPQQFYLTPAALPRIQHLMKNFTGSELVGNVSTDQMIAKLVGTSANCIVDGETKLNNNQKVVTYPILRFRGFASPIDQPTPFTDSDIKTEDKTTPVVVNPFVLSDTDDSDPLPF